MCLAHDLDRECEHTDVMVQFSIHSQAWGVLMLVRHAF